MIDLITRTAFGEMAALLLVAAVAGAVGNLLRQPLIVSFIAVGLLVGPSGLDLVHAKDQVDTLAHLGIAVLLFLVGIKLDLKLIRSLGAVSLMTGLGQVAFTSIVGFGIGRALGLDAVTSLYVSVALTFSSTIIVVKLLSDKREIDALHGQIALGFLIVQDLVVVLAMIVLSAIGIGSAGSAGGLADAIVAGAALVLLSLLFARYAAGWVTDRLARSPELLVVFAMAMAASFAAIGEWAGVGKEVGGLLAGIALASAPYRDAIAVRLGPLRDFLLLFFFIALGAGLDLSLLGQEIAAAAVFSIFVLIGNPLIVMVIMGVMGYRKRTGFLAGLTVAQISEFSLMFVAMGLALGHVGQDALGLVTLVGLVTIAASTYMITYSHRLYAVFEPMLGIFERRVTERESGGDSPRKSRYDVIVFGVGRFGTAIANRLENAGTSVLRVDFNPAVVKAWQDRGASVVFGDATDPEFLATLPLESARWVVSTIPVHATGVVHDDARLAILGAIRASDHRSRVAVTSHDSEDSAMLMRAGADCILEPFQDAADRAVEMLSGISADQRTEDPPTAPSTLHPPPARSPSPSLPPTRRDTPPPP